MRTTDLGSPIQFRVDRGAFDDTEIIEAAEGAHGERDQIAGGGGEFGLKHSGQTKGLIQIGLSAGEPHLGSWRFQIHEQPGAQQGTVQDER